jgi:glyceraldehyde-3-phosphate dehydrogenase/erythrose-4-phosphate dehydrogenase
MIFTVYKNSDIEIIVEDTGTGIRKFDAQDLLNKAKMNRKVMSEDPLSNKTIR